MTRKKKLINEAINKNIAFVKLLGVDGFKKIADEFKCSDRTVRRVLNGEQENLPMLQALVQLGEEKKAQKENLLKKLKELK